MAAETMITLFLGDRVQQLRHLGSENLRVKLAKTVDAYLVGNVVSFWVSQDKAEPEHTAEDLQGEEAAAEGAVPVD